MCPLLQSGGFNYTQGSYLEGFEFTANSAISITQLGAYDSNYSHLTNGAETFAPVEVAAVQHYYPYPIGVRYDNSF